MISPTPLAAFSDNYVWQFADGNGRCWLVDPGDPGVLQQALASPQPLAGILITHHHPDHIGALDRLADHPEIVIYAPRDARIPIASQRVVEGQQIDCGGVQFQVMETPGHTRSHVCYLGADVLFCGDTLFSLGCGRMFEGSPETLLGSLDRLAGLPGDPLVCCAHEYTEANLRFALQVDPDNPDLRAHGEWIVARRQAGQPSLPVRLSRERAGNPFLRSREPAIRAAIAAHAGRSFDTDSEWFGALRRWKDLFR